MRAFLHCLNIPGLRGYFAAVGIALLAVLLYLLYNVGLFLGFAAATFAYNR